METLLYYLGSIAGSFTGIIVSAVVSSIVLLMVFVPLLKIQKTFFPKLSDNEWAKFSAIVIVGVLFWWVIPTGFWYCIGKLLPQ